MKPSVLALLSVSLLAAAAHAVPRPMPVKAAPVVKLHVAMLPFVIKSFEVALNDGGAEVGAVGSQGGATFGEGRMTVRFTKSSPVNQYLADWRKQVVAGTLKPKISAGLIFPATGSTQPETYTIYGSWPTKYTPASLASGPNGIATAELSFKNGRHRKPLPKLSGRPQQGAAKQ